MDRSFLKFVWRYSKRDQILVLFLTVISFPLVYVSLEIPKIIINEAIEGRDFPKDVLGLELDQIEYLLALCFAFLALVVAINGIKWVMNIQIGMTGERMLRRLRYMLFERVMRFPMARYRTTKPGEVIQSLLGEIDPLGGFIGEVISTPAFQGGLLAVYTAFIFIQDFWLGLAAVALYPVQAWLVPKMQRRVIQLNKERAQNTRALADAISESVGNAPEIHTNDTPRWHMAQVAGRLHTNTLIRLALFRRKYTIKFVNNFMNQLTPFFFYSIGGYLVIRGRLDFGALVAVLAAYKDLAGPWKELLAYVQRWNDFNSRYVFVIENFSGDDILSNERIWPKEGTMPLEGPLTLSNVEGGPGTGGLTVASLKLEPGDTAAVTGGDNGAREALLRMVAGLELPVSGQVAIGDAPLAEATLPEIGTTVAFVGSEPGMVNRSIRDNLLYGLLHVAPDLTATKGADAVLLLRESRLTGNILADPEGDWINYPVAGVKDAAALNARLYDVIEQVGLGQSVLTGALDSRLSPDAAEAWRPRILQARAEFNAGWTDGEAREDLLEPWEAEAFNRNATLLENVLFALPVSAAPDIAAYAEQPAVTEVLDEIGAWRLLLEIGWDIAQEFAGLVEAVGETSTVLDSFNAYPRARILAAAELTVSAAGQALDTLKPEHRAMLVSLAAVYVSQRDGLDVLGDARIEGILTCRRRAHAILERRHDFVRFDEDRVSPAQTIAENIVNAKRRFDRRSAWRELDERLGEAVRKAGLRDELIGLGLDAPVGSGGSALSSSARRRIGLGRALMKRPRIFVLDGVAGSASESDCALRQVIRDNLPEAIMLFAAADEGAAAEADMRIVIDEGTVRVKDQRGSEPVRERGR